MSYNGNWGDVHTANIVCVLGEGKGSVQVRFPSNRTVESYAIRQYGMWNLQSAVRFVESQSSHTVCGIVVRPYDMWSFVVGCTICAD